MSHTGQSKFSGSKSWLRALQLTAPIAGNPHRVFPSVVQELAQRFGDKRAILSDRVTVSYGALSKRANQYARWATSKGLAKGDTICLLMPNCPEYLAIWIGITSIGGTVALLNTKLSGPSLAHCINVVSPKHIIASAELIGEITLTLPHLASSCGIWVHGSDQFAFPRIEVEIDTYCGDSLSSGEHESVALQDVALYIYTSGTTGLPKAATIRHYRIMQWSHWFAGMLDTQETDRMYNCLPMYHSVGGIVAPGAMLLSGGSIVLREGFSVSRFWEEIADWDCTLFQYIGELCRYLLRAPPRGRETGHRIRLCCGNGLRADIWDEFQTRFRIPRIVEFYAATEGNVSLYNIEGKVGAIGRVPPFLSHRFPLALIRLNLGSLDPMRDATGFCVQCAAHEVGEAIGRISTESPFDGYTAIEETEKKILRNVFKPGDSWFRTGDLMHKDEYGYFYFDDRIGDTFRWKGENVSTNEVSAVIASFSDVIEAAVYGVTIPHTDGRAGMAALVTRNNFRLQELVTYLERELPPYACPVFFRCCSAIESTGTFKQKKSELASEAYDPALTADPIYLYDRANKVLVRVDQEIRERLKKGELHL